MADATSLYTLRIGATVVNFLKSEDGWKFTGDFPEVSGKGFKELNDAAMAAMIAVRNEGYKLIDAATDAIVAAVTNSTVDLKPVN